MAYRATREFYYTVWITDITVREGAIVSDATVKEDGEYGLNWAIKEGWLVPADPPTWHQRLDEEPFGA